MTYILSFVIVAIIVAIRGRTTEIDSVRTEPTGRPRASRAASGSANERVGQS